MKNIKYIGSILLTLVFVIIVIFSIYKIRNFIYSNKSIVTHDIVINKITAMGKLELVKYAVKDIINFEESKFILPDEKILFISVGEVVACVDLTKVKKDDVKFDKDSITLNLPKPEICYTKIDHNQSKIYSISGIIFPTDVKDKVEKVYKIAEDKIYKSAIEMDILNKAEDNIVMILKPLLSNITGKKVGFTFK